MAPLLALLPALIGLGGTVAGIEASAGGGGGSSAGTPPAAPAIAKPAGPSGAQVSTATNAGANLTAQTGGGLSPNALTQLVSMLDTSGQGFGGAGQAAANNIYGTPG